MPVGGHKYMVVFHSFLSLCGAVQLEILGAKGATICSFKRMWRIGTFAFLDLTRRGAAAPFTISATSRICSLHDIKLLWHLKGEILKQFLDIFYSHIATGAPTESILKS